jgi:Spy/CpxP family protein refolding chaperone
MKTAAAFRAGALWLGLGGLSFGGSALANTPYAGLQTREVKALSDQQITDLREGRGMGYALAAELNGYPGPLHALELSDKLALTAGQRAATEKLFAAMKAETKPLGEELIAGEKHLDKLFATRAIETGSLEAATRGIADVQGRLRAAHLRYHLAMMDVMTPHQIAMYAQLRGYAGLGKSGGHHPGAH